MDAQRWLSELRREFIRRKLPPLYVERLLSELSDHLNDFTEDHMSMDATDLRDAVRPMGLPSQIAAAAASEFRKQRFSGRHPVITFVALPVLAVPLIWVAFLLVMISIIKLFGFEDHSAVDPLKVPHWVEASLPLVAAAYVLVPVVISAVYYCRLARKAAVGWKWPMSACFLLALVAGMAITEISMPAAGHRGHFTFGFGVSEHPHPSQVVQFAVPLAIGALATWHQARQRRRTLAV